ncbi:MAG: OadG family protein [Clostridia bacterium]|nr:OadG family protein [Clostridia bacterium]
MNLLEIKMPVGEAFLTSGIGVVTVLAILAVIACLIIYVSKFIRIMEEKANAAKKADVVEEVNLTAAPAAPVAADTMTGELELVKTDEKTAAVIMAIVSDQSGIPLNRLSFKSIKLMEE